MPYKGKKRKRSLKRQEQMEQQEKTYYSWKRAWHISMFVYLCVYSYSNAANAKQRIGPQILVAVVSAISCAIAGVRAYLFSKLPQKAKKKDIDWHSWSGLGIHPYITFAIEVLLVCVLFWDLTRPK